MKSPLRIYLVGAHATGKTTLARHIRDRYGIPMISEVARGVLAEMEARLDSLRSDIALVNHYQQQVFERQLEAESQQQGSFVSANSRAKQIRQCVSRPLGNGVPAATWQWS